MKTAVCRLDLKVMDSYERGVWRESTVQQKSLMRGSCVSSHWKWTREVISYISYDFILNSGIIYLGTELFSLKYREKFEAFLQFLLHVVTS